jgi:hypothetical protein
MVTWHILDLFLLTYDGQSYVCTGRLAYRYWSVPAIEPHTQIYAHSFFLAVHHFVLPASCHAP